MIFTLTLICNLILFLFLYRKLDAEREGKKKELSKHIPGPLQGQ